MAMKTVQEVITALQALVDMHPETADAGVVLVQNEGPPFGPVVSVFGPAVMYPKSDLTGTGWTWGAHPVVLLGVARNDYRKDAGG